MGIDAVMLGIIVIYSSFHTSQLPPSAVDWGSGMSMLHLSLLACAIIIIITMKIFMAGVPNQVGIPPRENLGISGGIGTTDYRLRLLGY